MEEVNYYSRLLLSPSIGYFYIKESQCEAYSIDEHKDDIISILKKPSLTIEDVRKLSCLFDSGLFSNNFEFINSLITEKKEIGHGEYGKVDEIKLESKKFALKTNERKKDTFREAYISSLLNRYVIEKHSCPNFVYMYGMLNNHNSIVYEFAEGSTIEDLKVEGEERDTEILSIILQVLCALALAQNEVKFIHNDLNDRNVIIQKTDEKDYKYDMYNYKISVKSRYLCKIIDYGVSTAYKDYESVNNIGLPEVLKSPRYDICRLCYAFLDKGCDELIGALLYSVIYGVYSKSEEEIIQHHDRYRHYLDLAEKRSEEYPKPYIKILEEILTGKNIKKEQESKYVYYKRYLNSVINITKK